MEQPQQLMQAHLPLAALGARLNLPLATLVMEQMVHGMAPKLLRADMEQLWHCEYTGGPAGGHGRRKENQRRTISPKNG
jgi:hypothetical protein